ncbi:cyclic nucleotide-binding domain-containing 2-like [Brachionus plicatilis]|uniref:Cyclic nucleotide-binding domain-containing 2-like n=1 Tax=Brachionus plicatilis TaxID=10195 RepID=A0A3M7R1E6_BRAPC|nr:cyclic nucleotide-binding domain-containing 2-like [Brachionus plicatilis]
MLKRFQRYSKMLMLLRQAVYSVGSNSNKEKLEEPENEEEKSALDGVLFNINNFSRPKEIGLNEETKRILKMPREKRNNNHVKTVCASLIEAVPEFMEFTPKIQKSIAQKAILQDFEIGRVIIRQNHRADNYYFIISGVASVFITKKNKITGETENKNVAFLRKGKSFGELAIINGSIRQENVICHTNVSVLTIDRDEFLKIFMETKEGQEPEHISFLHQIDLLKNWPLDLLPHNDPKICLLTYFRKGILICKNSLKNDWIIVIKQGSCRIVKEITIPKKNIAFAKKPLNPPLNYLDFYSNNQRYTSILRHEIHNELNLQYNFDKFIEPNEDDDEDDLVKNMSNDERKVCVEIKNLQSKEIFGLVEIAYSLEEEQNRVMLISDGVECILIHKFFFYKHMSSSLKILLKTLICPYPSDYDLQKKFQIQRDWNNYKRNLVKKNFFI